ncbi:MSHA biogenesis protein MshP [Thaumasiovibrio sp. DFM-14]|uniref:MSHA biogenesis protein MshP n=1 Tax=Thaumasiovibrio sp. DFM-14 TaxID=3384792 RepID=UPI0039A2B7A5
MYSSRPFFLGKTCLLAKPIKQGGSVLLTTVFIIVVVALFAGGLSRLLWSNQETTTLELLGSRAWWAAHSGNEVALNQLFPVDQRVADLSVCPDGSQQMALPPLDLHGCEIAVICSNYSYAVSAATSSAETERYFLLESTASCGSGKYRVSRVQELLARDIE